MAAMGSSSCSSSFNDVHAIHAFISFPPCWTMSQRDGCPKIINLGSAKTDLFYEKKKYGYRKR